MSEATSLYQLPRLPRGWWISTVESAHVPRPILATPAPNYELESINRRPTRIRLHHPNGSLVEIVISIGAWHLKGCIESAFQAAMEKLENSNGTRESGIF